MKKSNRLNYQAVCHERSRADGIIKMEFTRTETETADLSQS